MFQRKTFRIFQSRFCTDNPLIALYGLGGAFPNDCEWGEGATVAIILMLLWFAVLVTLILSELLKEGEQRQAGLYRPKERPRVVVEEQVLLPARCTGPAAHLAQ
jgi:hypothetical protein